MQTFPSQRGRIQCLGSKIIMQCRSQARGYCLLNFVNKVLFIMVVHSSHLPSYCKRSAANPGLCLVWELEIEAKSLPLHRDAMYSLSYPTDSWEAKKRKKKILYKSSESTWVLLKCSHLLRRLVWFIGLI